MMLTVNEGYDKMMNKKLVLCGIVTCLVVGISDAVEIDPITTRWTFGAHESFVMYRRVGKNCTGGIEGNAQWVRPWLDWFDEHAPEKMADVGLNFLHSRFYKGMGWEIEKLDFPKVKGFVSRCHEHGIRALAYVQFATLYPEAMRREIPGIDTWSSVDWKGVANTYYGGSYFRTLPCLNCPEWEAYIKRMCTIALNEGKFDGIMFDNVFDYPCYCPRCVKSFRAYVAREVNDPAGRFGYDAAEHIDLPKINRDMYEALDIKDPIVQIWFDWRSETVSGVMRRFREHIKCVNPDAIVSGNPSPYRMRAMHVVRGQDMVDLSRYFDFIVMQTGCAPQVRANGEVVNRIRELKFAQDYGPRIVALCDADARDLGCDAKGFLLPMIEDLVFGGTPTDRTILAPKREPGFIGRRRFAFRKPLHVKFNAFARDHRAELTAPTIHSVRLLYPEHEVILSEKVQQNLLAAEEILIRNRVPFGYLVSTPAKPFDIPEGMDILVLPGLVTLSDAQIAAVEKYAKAGGRLVVTGEAGRYDGINGERFEDPLVKLKDLSNVVWREDADFSGMAHYNWTSAVPPPKDGGRAMMRDLENAGYRAPVVIEGLPDHVAAEYRCLADGRLVVHLINYDIRHPVRTARVVLSAGLKGTVETPFEEMADSFDLSADGVLPSFSLYLLLIIK